MKKIVKSINNAFISVVLTFFYLIVFGFSFLLLAVLKRIKRKPPEATSYWQTATASERDPYYFLSAY